MYHRQKIRKIGNVKTDKNEGKEYIDAKNIGINITYRIEFEFHLHFVEGSYGNNQKRKRRAK